MTISESLDARAKPPPAMRQLYKEYQVAKHITLDQKHDLVQFDESFEPSHSLVPLLPDAHLKPAELAQASLGFLGDEDFLLKNELSSSRLRGKIYQVANMPGLFVYPQLLLPTVQLSLLDQLLHREVAASQHQTNVHLHYHVPRPAVGESYFSRSAAGITFQPKDASIHKAFGIRDFLNRKLRWTTLGGQYDWTNKVYPPGSPPEFPAKIKKLVQDLFPMKAEAAIVNIYSPGDTLSLHRDVSEECNRPLVSISLGCDAIFICGLEAKDATSAPRTVTLRLRSGDAVLMSGASRYAWHGVPKVLKGTCPAWMASWPASDKMENDEFESWQAWMENKRVNLNVRQMFA